MRPALLKGPRYFGRGAWARSKRLPWRRKKQKKKSPQKAILEKERPFIIEARSKGYSVGVIAEYLSKRHGIKISGATVRKFVLEHFREEENSESAGV